MTDPNQKADVLDHVVRPDLPWRTAVAVECGRMITDVTQTITRDQLWARANKLGLKRTSFTVCMTCWQTAKRWETFEKDPVDAMRREVYATVELLAAELRALGALAQAHPEEFAGFLTGLTETISLADARRAKLRKAR